ncbi:hypothetical protein ASPWEDRAFT_348221 [Aspergillus wentii DTO 134E9]|uniref:ER-bound oxygenase mpaB/mpaB'/Rubber oxygenase catalytic domain-containing protein n=1 Tax=Aspergillus wentii DTO 134E9 TaxID=1073089 RepID=A0A1L9RVK4_ASPWE|nr:uncharacterized protein ASPWEDRAFT_348221 [Aspergillus wentii DTO 134E9]KAI9928851.1 hypothetical protein MW887_002073 [Aspergillus wentii]OJJ38955.1 hypothetical protein ASPWEDRAFT_348221 [Aspergillus wentii DTO 134E9]
MTGDPLLAPVASANSTARAFLPTTSSSSQIFSYALVLLVSYPILISLLRFRRVNRLHQKYAKYSTRESLAQMTDDEAFEIQQAMVKFEFPFFFITALQFALFRTYGIPSISKLLVKTGEFSNAETSFKRYSDTNILIQEFMGNAPTSKRAYSGLARTRYMHSGYRASGKILDDDMLYTLGLFAIQPVRFVESYEWRKMTDLERCAMGTFWKSVGDGLDISYDKLPSGKTGFRDGVQWLEEIAAWSDEYEAQNMVPHPANRETADQTTPVILYMVPKPLEQFGLKFVSFMMDERLRKAMYYDPPSPSQAKLFSSLLSIRKFTMRYLAFPRPNFLPYETTTNEPDENGRFFVTSWDADPYYVKPSLWNRWGPIAWITWALGRPLPGDEGGKYYPQGYHTENAGPKSFEGKGLPYLEKTVEEYKTSRTGKCPFH